MSKKNFYIIFLLACLASCRKVKEDTLFIGMSRKVHDYIDPVKGISRFDTIYPEIVKVLESRDSIFFTVESNQIAFEKNKNNTYQKSLQGQRATIQFQLTSTDSLKYMYSFSAQANTLYRIEIKFNGEKQ